MSDILNPTPDIQSARAAFRAFLNSCAPEEKLLCLHDSDADGITAGVLWQRALERLGFSNLVRIAPDRERNAWTHSNRQRVQEHAPDKMFLLDLGSQAQRVLETVPLCLIDHHHPEGCPPQDTLISAYNWNPIPNTSLLFYDLCHDLVDISDLDWIAAIGTFSDLGEKAPFEIIASTKKQYTAKYLKEATALVNASRRAADYDPESAAQALLTHDSPRALVNSDAEAVQVLARSRAQVKAELNEAKKAAPVFAGQAALIRMDSPCQIHPLIAQIWRSRLPKYFVIAANTGYLPGRVNFSCRGEGVLQWLRSFDLGIAPDEESGYGHGHDAASGGSLPIEKWNLLLEQIGFAPDV